MRRRKCPLQSAIVVVIDYRAKMLMKKYVVVRKIETVVNALQACITAAWLLFVLDRFHTCDFFAQFLSYECATLSRDKVADAATVELHAATLSRKQTRLLRHFSSFHDPALTNTVPKWWNRFMSNLFWTLRLIVRFRFATQPTETKLLATIS